MSRYEGKPFLKLLEAYVLKAIGHIPIEQERALGSMEEKLRIIYRADGAWYQIVEKQMDFPANFDTKINEIWVAGLPRALADGFQPDPNEFARQFVDQNFNN